MMTRQDLEILLRLRTDSSEVKTLQNSLGGLRGTLERIVGLKGGLAGVLTGLTGGAVVAGMLRLTQQAVVLSDAIEKNRETLKLSAAETQVFASVLKDAGASGDEYIQAIAKIQKAVGDADPVIRRLGLSLSSLKGQTGGQQLESVAVALAGIKNESERASVSGDLLGKSYTELRPLLDALAQRGFPALQEEVRKSRGIMSDYASKELDNAVDRTAAASEKIAKSLSGVRLAWERVKAASTEAVAAIVDQSAIPSQIRDLTNARDALSARRAGLDLLAQNTVSAADLQTTIEYLNRQIAVIDGQISKIKYSANPLPSAPASGRNGSIRAGVQNELDLLAQQNVIAAQNEQFAKNVFITQIAAYMAEGKAKVFDFYQTIRDQIAAGDRVQRAARASARVGSIDKRVEELSTSAERLKANLLVPELQKRSALTAIYTEQNAQLREKVRILREEAAIEQDRAAREGKLGRADAINRQISANEGEAEKNRPTTVMQDLQMGMTQLQNSFVTLGEAGAGIMATGFNGLVDQLTQAIVLTGDLGAAFGNLKMLLLTEVVRAIVQMGAQWVTTHLIMKGVSIGWHALLSALGWAQVADVNAQEVAKKPALATNAALAAGGSYGISAILGLAALLALVAAVSSFEYGGDTGNGPRSGGLDGKGGRLAVIHPQETIIDRYHGTIGDIRLPANDAPRYVDVAPAARYSGGDVSGGTNITIASFNGQTEAETYLRSRTGTLFIQDQVRQVVRQYR